MSKFGEWQDIETAPKDRTILLNKEGSSWVNLGWYSAGRGLFLYHTGADATDATHWMPLPEPPKPRPTVTVDLEDLKAVISMSSLVPCSQPDHDSWVRVRDAAAEAQAKQ